MNANIFFSFNRFVLLVRNDLILNKKQYLIAMIAILIIGFFLIKMQMSTVKHPLNFDASMYKHAFESLLLGLAIMIGMFSFLELNAKNSKLSYLLLPFSTFEKYSSQFFVKIILGIIVFIAIFWIDAYLARLITLATYGDQLKVIPVIEPFHLSTLCSFYNTQEQMLILMLQITVGVGLFSSRLFFNKSGMIKSAIAYLVLFYFITSLVFILSRLYFVESEPYTYYVHGKLTNLEMFYYCVICFSWLFLPLLGYFKLKEKQL